jgi:hypothetical protein
VWWCTPSLSLTDLVWIVVATGVVLLLVAVPFTRGYTVAAIVCVFYLPQTIFHELAHGLAGYWTTDSTVVVYFGLEKWRFGGRLKIALGPPDNRKGWRPCAWWDLSNTTTLQRWWSAAAGTISDITIGFVFMYLTAITSSCGWQWVWRFEWWLSWGVAIVNGLLPLVRGSDGWYLWNPSKLAQHEPCRS